MSWQWWLALSALILGLGWLFGSLALDRWRNAREERLQAVSGALTGATDEWADTLHGIRVHAAEAESLEDTANIDMTWLRTHLDMEDIEEKLHEGLRIVDHFVELFLDDIQWDHIMEMRRATADV